MRAVQKRAFRQFRVLKWQQDENAFLGRCMLNLFGGVLNIHGWRNQQKETRSVLLSQFIQYTEAGKRLGHRSNPFRRVITSWPKTHPPSVYLMNLTNITGRVAFL